MHLSSGFLTLGEKWIFSVGIADSGFFCVCEGLDYVIRGFCCFYVVVCLTPGQIS